LFSRAWGNGRLKRKKVSGETAVRLTPGWEQKRPAIRSISSGMWSGEGTGFMICTAHLHLAVFVPQQQFSHQLSHGTTVGNAVFQHLGAKPAQSASAFAVRGRRSASLNPRDEALSSNRKCRDHQLRNPARTPYKSISIPPRVYLGLELLLRQLANFLLLPLVMVS
jgi:hypothetical protein